MEKLQILRNVRVLKHRQKKSPGDAGAFCPGEVSLPFCYVVSCFGCFWGGFFLSVAAHPPLGDEGTLVLSA